MIVIATEIPSLAAHHHCCLVKLGSRQSEKRGPTASPYCALHKPASANERSHGNDDEAELTKSHVNAPLCPYGVSKRLELCRAALTLRKLNLKLATGDHYSMRWLLDLHCHSFESLSGLCLFCTWWHPGNLVTVISNQNPYRIEGRKNALHGVM